MKMKDLISLHLLGKEAQIQETKGTSGKLMNRQHMCIRIYNTHGTVSFKNGLLPMIFSNTQHCVKRCTPSPCCQNR